MIRKLKKSELEASIRMSEFAFQYDMTDKERQERLGEMKAEQTLVIEEDGQIVSKLTVLPLYTYLHGLMIPMGGVSGVVTLPEHRRRGHVAKLLHHAFSQMKQEGQLLSFLYPFSVPFYRRFGYELFADQQKITLTRAQLPAKQPYKGSYQVVEKGQAIELLDKVYQEWATDKNGPLVRDKKWWKQSIFKRKKGRMVVYKNDNDTPRGYMIYEVKNDHMTVSEIIWLDPEAREALFTLMSQHDSMAETFTLTLAHDEMPFLLPDPKVKREVNSYFMARIIDVESLLTLVRFHFKEGERVLLSIHDELCPWNTGIFQLEASSAPPTKVTRISDREHEESLSSCLLLDIQTLAVIILNAHRPHALYKEGLIRGDKGAVDILERATPNKEVFFYDFF
ncbi:GNAT family N-acetyltransferase [Paenalkalicoccus suaedae]|uniref:GNAT family N-acetyltransferase n=1 Tax=Paenalkalicoccus suaedae TaxID=2592382 RepID=A0A859FCT3_9BACI|nr:GNAT family N-acetyltransferase [Paenalkalicoccus suaedae]QKS70562.1 GNAT family N-acetyltransferase [Paenalkalicoccus suaedae]